MKISKVNSTVRLYFRETMKLLLEFSQEILQDNDGIFRGKIQRKGEEIRKELNLFSGDANDDFLDNIQELEQLYKIIDLKMQTLINDISEGLQDAMKSCFKETYADIIALYIIGFKDNENLWENYLEVFKLSEGYDIEEKDIDLELINRVAAVVKIMSSLSEDARISWRNLVEESKSKWLLDVGEHQFISSIVVYANTYLRYMSGASDLDEDDINIAQNMPTTEKITFANLDETWAWQINYLEEVCELLYSKIYGENEERQDIVEKIRGLYRMLNNENYFQKGNGLKAFDDIVSWYVKLVEEMKKGDGSI